MKKRIISFISTLIIACSLFAVLPTVEASAISQADVSSRLTSLIRQYEGRTGNWNFAKASQCCGFAHMIFNNIFGRGTAPVGTDAYSSNPTCYKFNNVARDITTIGILPPDYSSASLENLLEKAAPGDYLQMKRRASGGPHSMIVVSVNAAANTIEIFDANKDGKGKVFHYTKTFAQFQSDNQAVSLYRYAGYTPTTANNPEGAVDYVQGGTGTVWVRGWTFDGDNTSQSLSVHVYIGGPAGVGEGHEISANKGRSDVNSIYGISGNHGFDQTIATSKTGSQPVYIYGINIGSGENVLLGQGTANIAKDTVAPTISNVYTSKITNSSYTVTCNVSDNAGVTKVRFPTFTPGSSEAVWYDGTVSNGTASCTIPVTKEGTYRTDIYVYDAQGNYGWGSINTKADPDDPLIYEYNNGKYVIRDCVSKAGGCVVIPETKNGLTVFRLGAKAFENCTGIEGIVLPDTIYRIAAECFNGCTGLKSVVIPASVTETGGNIFKNCPAVTDIFYKGNKTQWNSIKHDSGSWGLPDNAKVHEDGTYKYTMPETNIELSLSLKTGSDGFVIEGCNKDAKGDLTIPSCISGINVYKIENNAFQKCTGLTSVGIPKSVNKLGNSVFEGCSGLTKIYYEGSKESWDDILNNGGSLGTDAAFTYGGYNVPGTNAILAVELEGGEYVINDCNEDASGDLVIPDKIYGKNVRRIGLYAFQNCSKLTSVTVPSTAQRLGRYTFQNCSSLTEVTIPKAAAAFGVTIFDGCSKLKDIYYEGTQDDWNSIVIDEGSLGTNAEVHCSIYNVPGTNAMLTIAMENGKYVITDCNENAEGKIVIPAKVYGTEVGRVAREVFTNCSKITTVSIASGYRVGSLCFSGCTALESVTLPDSLTEIGDNVFDGCSSLKTIYYKGAEADWNNIVNHGAIDSLNVPIRYNAGDHNYVPEVVKPTCTEEGYTVYRCSDCGDSYISDKKPAAGHKEVIDKSVAATCTENGKTEGRHCSVCNKVLIKQEVITATGHGYDSWTVAEENSCTEDGLLKRVCNTCKKEETKTFEKKGHQYGKWIYEKGVTCDSDGQQSRVCIFCGDIEKEIIKATGHEWSDSYQIVKEPTCEEQGTEAIICQACGKIDTSRAVKATGHSWTDWKDSSKTGYQERECSVCHSKETRQKDHKHTVVEDKAIAATCTKAGLTAGSHCSTCGEVIKKQETVPVLEHTWDQGRISQEATCNEAGIMKYLCKVCGTAKTEAVEKKGHEWNSDYTVDKEATCTEAGIKSIHCKNCKATTDVQSVVPTGHTWNSSYTVDKEATCTTEGSKSIHCRKCDDTKNTTVIKKIGHTYGEWITDKQPTCTEAGSKHRICEVCDNVDRAQIAVVAHTWNSSYTVDKEATCTSEGSKSIHCKNCKAIKNSTAIEKIPHTYADQTQKATATKNGYTKKVCSCGDVQSTSTLYYPKTVKLSTSTYTYNGKAKKPSVKVYDSAGKLISASNYTVKYAAGRKNVGKYKVTVTFKSTSKYYTGSKYAYLKINPKGTSISSVTKASKAFTAKWKKQSSKMATSRITGYQIRYSTSSKMTNAKTVTIKGYTKTSKKISKLKSKKTYYVQVRTYKTVSGTHYYSSWSKAKAVKTK